MNKEKRCTHPVKDQVSIGKEDSWCGNCGTLWRLWTPRNRCGRIPRRERERIRRTRNA